MDKVSRYELQKLDCNCNDCFFLERDLEKLNWWRNRQYRWDIVDFIKFKRRLRLKASDNLSRGNVEAYKNLIKQADELKFQKSSKSKVAYGFCQKKQKDVSFISNQCVPEHQECFQHRIDHWDNEKREKYFSTP